MKSAKSIKNIITVAAIILISTLCLNISFAMTKATIIVETANLRKEASEDSTILEQISLNEEVEILEKTNDWYKVKYGEYTGYISKEYTKVIGEDVDNTENDKKPSDNESTDSKNTSSENDTDKEINTQPQDNNNQMF